MFVNTFLEQEEHLKSGAKGTKWTRSGAAAWLVLKTRLRRTQGAQTESWLMTGYLALGLPFIVPIHLAITKNISESTCGKSTGALA